jgi:hypothetical protein
MTESPWMRLRLRAEADERISPHAYRVLCRIISWRVRLGEEIDEPFTLPWPLVRQWIGREKDQCRAYLLELETFGYLHRQGAQGCPPTRLVRLVAAAGVKGGKNPTLKGGKNPTFESGENPTLKGGKNPTLHISTVFQTRKNKRGASRPRLEAAQSAAGKGDRVRSAGAPLKGGGSKPSEASASAGGGSSAAAPAAAEREAWGRANAHLANWKKENGFT